MTILKSLGADPSIMDMVQIGADSGHTLTLTSAKVRRERDRSLNVTWVALTL